MNISGRRVLVVVVCVVLHTIVCWSTVVSAFVVRTPFTTTTTNGRRPALGKSSSSTTSSTALSFSFSFAGILGKTDKAAKEREKLRKQTNKFYRDRKNTDSRTRSLDKRLTAFEQAIKSPASNKNRNVVWDPSLPATIQGGSLQRWAFPSPTMQRVQLVMLTDGRPLNADVDLWQGPDNTPYKLRVYNEDGILRPFSAAIMTPRGSNTVCIKNIGPMEFPMEAFVTLDTSEDRYAGPSALRNSFVNNPRTIQGGSLRPYQFRTCVESVQVLLKTDGRPLNAKIELLQGPNNIKQKIEVYAEDGNDRPFFAVIETPGSGNVIRVVNTGPMEYPLDAWVEPYLVGESDEYGEPDVVLGGSDTGYEEFYRTTTR